MRRFASLALGLCTFCVVTPATVLAQPWDFYEDPISGEQCDLVNAQNAELVVYSDSGELVIVSGNDLFLGDSFVDGDANVFFDGIPFGVIAFATDGNGFRSLWWLTDSGSVVAIDPDALFPFDSLAFPEDFVGVECDACPFWDHPEDCVPVVDLDNDGVPDDFDDCPFTSPGEDVDAAGCSCEDLGDCDCFVDSDLDGVVNCQDLCEGTPLDADVDFAGCACFEVDDDDDGVDNCDDQCPNSPAGADVDLDGCTVVVVQPGPVIIGCGNFGPLMLGLMFAGLFVMRFVGQSV